MPWFQRADGQQFCVLDHYDDLIARLRAESLRNEGWLEIPAPSAQPQSDGSIVASAAAESATLEPPVARKARPVQTATKRRAAR